MSRAERVSQAKELSSPEQSNRLLKPPCIQTVFRAEHRCPRFRLLRG